MEVPKIIIEIRGGYLQAVYSTSRQTEYILIDYDDLEDREAPVSGIHCPDGTAEELHTFYDENPAIQQQLKELGY